MLTGEKNQPTLNMMAYCSIAHNNFCQANFCHFIKLWSININVVVIVDIVVVAVVVDIVVVAFLNVNVAALLPSSAKPQLPAAAKLAELQPYFAFHPSTPTPTPTPRASRF